MSATAHYRRVNRRRPASGCRSMNWFFENGKLKSEIFSLPFHITRAEHSIGLIDGND